MKNEKQAKAFLLIAQSEHSGEILGHYQSQLTELDQRSRYLRGDDLLIVNGRRQMLEEVIKDLTDAKGIVERQNKPRSTGGQGFDSVLL